MRPNGGAEIKALDFLAAVLAEIVQLFRRLDPFRNHTKTEFGGNRDDGE